MRQSKAVHTYPFAPAGSMDKLLIAAVDASMQSPWALSCFEDNNIARPGSPPGNLAACLGLIRGYARHLYAVLLV